MKKKSCLLLIIEDILYLRGLFITQSNPYDRAFYENN